MPCACRRIGSPRGLEGAIAAAPVARAGSRVARGVVNWGGGGWVFYDGYC